MSAAVPEFRLRAAFFAMAAVGIASAQDAIVKQLASGYPVYEIMVIRGLVGLPILGIWLAFTHGFSILRTPVIWPLLLRGAVLCSAYLAFILAIAAMPIANGVSIYFTMPFFVAMLAGPFLGERVPIYRWLAIVAAFIGVIIMVRPGASNFEPASFLALYSAFGYAVGQMMGRHYSQTIPPLVLANVQNWVYLGAGVIMILVFYVGGVELKGHKSLEFLTRPAVWPTAFDFMLLTIMGVFAAVGSVLFTWAYKSAASSFVAPFEYTAMIWAVLYGLFLFGDFPDALTWVGMAIVIAAGLWMTWRDGRYSTG
jgi:drug/metabolite transporter (DMT)-like permease